MMAATTFARLVALCGLSQQEAADFLGIAKKTVSMKTIGQRKATDDELHRLAALWLDVKRNRVGEDVPIGAHERARAIMEAVSILRGSLQATRES